MLGEVDSRRLVGSHRGQLRTGLGHAPGGEHRPAQVSRVLQQAGRGRCAADQQCAQLRTGRTGLPLQDSLQHGRHHGRQGDRLFGKIAQHPGRLEARVEMDRAAADHAADQDRESADVFERQTQQPLIRTGHADAPGDCQRACPVVIQRKRDGFWRRTAARGEHDGGAARGCVRGRRQRFDGRRRRLAGIDERALVPVFAPAFILNGAASKRCGVRHDRRRGPQLVDQDTHSSGGKLRVDGHRGSAQPDYGVQPD